MKKDNSSSIVVLLAVIIILLLGIFGYIVFQDHNVFTNKLNQNTDKNDVSESYILEVGNTLYQNALNANWFRIFVIEESLMNDGKEGYLIRDYETVMDGIFTNVARKSFEANNEKYLFSKGGLMYRSKEKKKEDATYVKTDLKFVSKTKKSLTFNAISTYLMPGGNKVQTEEFVLDRIQGTDDNYLSEDYRVSKFVLPNFQSVEETIN